MRAHCVVAVSCHGIVAAGHCCVPSWPLRVVVPGMAFSFGHLVAQAVLGTVELN